MRRFLTPLLPLLVALALPAAPATARIPIRVGIGDQRVATFSNPAFQRAHFARIRYVVPWNLMDHSDVRLTARQFVQTARRHHMQVLLHVSTDDYRIKRAHLPSVAAYRSKVGRLVRYFRHLGVRDFGTWDEANHASQPTYRSPAHAADYFRELYRAVRPHCRTCGIVALDVLDQHGVERYIADFYRHLSRTYRRRASVVGLHNYGDVNRLRTTYTRSMIHEVHRYNGRARFWLTETGGIVKFGRSFPYSPTRAAHRLRQMFRIADLYRRSGIQRLYVYQWTGAGADARFDAGLTNPDGSTRPGYSYLRSKLSRYMR